MFRKEDDPRQIMEDSEMKKLLLCTLLCLCIGAPVTSVLAGSDGYIYHYTYYATNNCGQAVGWETYNTCTGQRTLSGTITSHYTQSTTYIPDCGGSGPPQ